jgi:hypothetical protein
MLERWPQLRPRISSFVPPGWDSELAAALEALVHLTEGSGVAIHVNQYKEKFGALRVYLSIDEASVGPLTIVEDTAHHTSLRSSAKRGSVRERAMQIVDGAAARCSALCEHCGAPGQLRDNNKWLHVVCDVHADGLLPHGG